MFTLEKRSAVHHVTPRHVQLRNRMNPLAFGIEWLMLILFVAFLVSMFVK